MSAGAMMTMDDEEPIGRAALLAKPALDRLGIAELESYIAGLRGEIARVEGEIARKAGLKNAADAFFRMP